MFPMYKTKRSNAPDPNLAAEKRARFARENAINPATGFAPRRLRTPKMHPPEPTPGALCSPSIPE